MHATIYNRNLYNNIQLSHMYTHTQTYYIATYIKLQTYIHNTNFVHTTTNIDLGLHATKTSYHRNMTTTVKLVLPTLLHSKTHDPS